jgi:tetratricopeptide (TPR) repeat protein
MGHAAGELPLAAQATSLNELSVRLAEQGRHEEGLDAIQEAVTAYRQLAKQRDAHVPGLAKSLDNLADLLGDLERREESLEASQAAVTTHRWLAEQHDSYLPDFAISLHNLALRLGGWAVTKKPSPRSKNPSPYSDDSQDSAPTLTCPTLLRR